MRTLFSLLLPLLLACAPRGAQPPSDQAAGVSPPPLVDPSSVIEGGTDANTAAPIELKKQADGALTATWGVQPRQSPQYFRFEAAPGYGIVFRVTSREAVKASLRDGEGKQLASNDRAPTLRWSAAFGRSSNKYLLVLTVPGKELTTSAELRLRDQTDAGSGRDAGGDFNSALPIFDVVGGWVDGEADKSDYYRIQVTRGSALDLSVTPDADMQLKVEIYDLNRARRAEASSGAKGGVARVSWKPPYDGFAYIVIRHGGGEGGGYKME